jgi:hypothetical protein
MAAWRSAEMTRRGQLGVLVTDVRVGQVPVAGAARVDDLGGARGSVGEGQAHLGGEPLVGREGVVGPFVVSQCPVDQPPDVIAVDPVVGELVDEHVAIQEGYRDGVGDVHLSADHLQRALGLPRPRRLSPSSSPEQSSLSASPCPRRVCLPKRYPPGLPEPSCRTCLHPACRLPEMSDRAAKVILENDAEDRRKNSRCNAHQSEKCPER